MTEKLTNYELSAQYVILCNAWKGYIELGLFEEKLDLEYKDEKYRIAPNKIGIPVIEKDPEWKEIVKTWVWFKYIQLINDYDLMFLINKTIYTYIKIFVTFDNEDNEDILLPQYEN